MPRLVSAERPLVTVCWSACNISFYLLHKRADKFYCPTDTNAAFKQDLYHSNQDNLMTRELAERDIKGLL